MHSIVSYVCNTKAKPSLTPALMALHCCYGSFPPLSFLLLPQQFCYVFLAALSDWTVANHKRSQFVVISHEFHRFHGPCVMAYYPALLVLFAFTIATHVFAHRLCNVIMYVYVVYVTCMYMCMCTYVNMVGSHWGTFKEYFT